jgi:alpha-tubulin suppressor-like RCC1 family protein
VKVNLDADDVPVSVAAGYFHTCALLRNKSVQCFGNNGNGQLGNGSNDESNVPVKVNLDADDVPLSVAAGYFHTCIRLQDNTIKCFGANSSGQLGNGSNDDSNVPVKVNLDADDVPVSVAAGGYHTCIRFQNNTVKCFGYNYLGQLGLGFKSYSEPDPKFVIGFGN